MKNIYSLILVLPIFLASCDFGVVGNGKVESKDKEIDRFTELVVEGNFDVFLKQDKRSTLRIEADENLHDIIRVRQSGDRLYIESTENIVRAKKKSLYLTCRDLEKVELTGAVDLETEAPIEVRTLSIYCSGAADLEMDLVANKLRFDISGAANCDIEGQTDEIRIDLSGAGDFDAVELEAKEVHIDLSGAAKARVHATEELNVEISGVGSVKYKGNPDIQKSISGIGSLKRY